MNDCRFKPKLFPCNRCNSNTNFLVQVHYVCNAKLCSACFELYKNCEVTIYKRKRNHKCKSFQDFQFAHPNEVVCFRREPYLHPRVRLIDKTKIQQQQRAISALPSPIRPELDRKHNFSLDSIKGPTLIVKQSIWPIASTTDQNQFNIFPQKPGFRSESEISPICSSISPPKTWHLNVVQKKPASMGISDEGQVTSELIFSDTKATFEHQRQKIQRYKASV